jgi:pre-mRNA-processing factor 6
VLIDREAWITMAEEAEKAGSPLTCGSIIRATIGQNVEKEDRKRTWLADAEVRMLV